MGSIVVAIEVVGINVVGTGFALSGVKVQASINRNSTSSIATKPLPLFPLTITNCI